MIRLVKSRNLKHYRAILEGLVDDFGYIYYHAILSWCGFIDTKDPETYWKVWLIKRSRTTVGICGLYSLKKKDVRELWLGWFGILKQYRNNGIGVEVLQQLEETAKKAGAESVMAYVKANNKALDFYKRNGYRIVSRVGAYVDKHKLTMDQFENRTDLVIKKNLYE